MGYAEPDTLDEIEILGVSSEPSKRPNQGGFTVTVMYGMAGVAAVGGIGFFVYSSRQMKKDKDQGQTGIDPSRLIGYSTSESSGSYKTNRGEAQLRDDTSYQQTRNVYEGSTQDPPTTIEAACGCATSSDMDNQCDCQMQNSCLCDASCQCNASVCKEHRESF